MKRLLFLILMLVLHSCNDGIELEKENSNQIISLLFEQLAKPIDPVFPPTIPDSLNHTFTSKGSTRIDSLIKQVKKKRAERRLIAAIDSLIKPYLNVSLNNIDESCNDYLDILSKLKRLKDTLKIDISTIENIRNDSIIYFKEELLTEGSRDFFEFDMLLSFSRIAFNEDYTKAVLKVSESQSKLAGSSSLYFLEKVNNKWQIRCTKGLLIS